MKKYNYDLQVNPTYESTDFHVSRSNNLICFYDKTSGLIEVTSHGYSKCSIEIKRQAIELCEKLVNQFYKKVG